MNNLIIDPSAPGLVNPAHDKFLDSPATKRELQAMINHFAKHLDEVYATLDTQHIVLNCIGEKLNITKDELLAYVARKKQEIADLAIKRESKKPTEAASEQSNG